MWHRLKKFDSFKFIFLNIYDCACFRQPRHEMQVDHPLNRRFETVSIIKKEKLKKTKNCDWFWSVIDNRSLEAIFAARGLKECSVVLERIDREGTQN